MSSRIPLAVAAGVIAASSFAGASPLTVDIQALYQAPAYTGIGADTSDGIASGNVVWNSITAGTGSATTASNGTALTTPILFSDSVGNPNFYQPSDYPTSSATDITNLLGQGFYGGAATFELQDVTPGTYELYLYTSCGGYDASQGGEVVGHDLGTQFTVSTEGTPAQTAGADDKSDTSFSPGPDGNYVVFSIDVGADEKITGSYTPDTADNSGQSEFNGLQLVQVPEPASLGILSLGALGAMTRRRRA